MDIQLNQDELKELKRIQQKDRFHRRRFIKATVLLMLHRKLSLEDIQASLNIDDNTIRRYVKGYREKGLKRYLEDGYIPYSGKLSEQQERALSEELDTYLYTDAGEVCVCVEQTFGVKYTISGMRDLLHRLGFVYKHTKSVPSKADEAAQREFLEQTLPGLLDEVKAGKAEVYYLDGTHPTHNTKTGRGWIRKGEDFSVDCNSGRKRVNINGAVRATKPEHLVYDVTDSVNAQSTKRLCQKLLAKHPDKTIYLIGDNARYYRCKWLQEWPQKQRVEFIFLPAYSPNLNLIERFWWFLRKEVLESTYYDTYAKFRQGIIDFLDNTKSCKEEIRQLLTLNFQTVEGYSVYAQTTS